jgi:hypothetical protein
LRANFLFRAVALPPGQHVVQFHYDPASFEQGLTIARASLVLAGLALAACLAAAVGSRRSRTAPAVGDS